MSDYLLEDSFITRAYDRIRILRGEKIHELHQLPLLADTLDVEAKGFQSQQTLREKAGLRSLVSFQALLLTHCGNAQNHSHGSRYIMISRCWIRRLNHATSIRTKHCGIRMLV